MFLSIIIPVYNTEKYLHKCIQSCLDQNIEYSDYEIICVNDGSKDKSLSILKEFEHHNKNVVVINQPNRGVSAARNAGASIAKGDYIWFVDSDDYIETNCLGKLKKMSYNNCDIIGFGAYSFGQSFSKDEYEHSKAKEFENNRDFFYGAHFTYLYKSELLKNHKIQYFEGIAYGEDTLFSHEATNAAANLEKTKDIFYFYRKAPESAMNSLQQPEKRLKFIDSTIAVIEILKKGVDCKRFTVTSSKRFIQSKYKQYLMMLARVKIKDAIRSLKTMDSMHLLDKDFLQEYGLPKKEKIIFVYVTKHFKIWFRSFLRKILPKSLVALLYKFIER